MGDATAGGPTPPPAPSAPVAGRSGTVMLSAWSSMQARVAKTTNNEDIYIQVCTAPPPSLAVANMATTAAQPAPYHGGDMPHAAVSSSSSFNSAPVDVLSSAVVAYDSSDDDEDDDGSAEYLTICGHDDESDNNESDDESAVVAAVVVPPPPPPKPKPRPVPVGPAPASQPPPMPTPYLPYAHNGWLTKKKKGSAVTIVRIANNNNPKTCMFIFNLCCS